MNPRQRHDPTKSLVGFVVGDVEYAVEIARVREIANPMPVVPLPHAPAAVAGVADYRGEVVPVVSLRAHFAMPPAPATRRTKWLVVDVAGRFVALVVDGVTEVFGTGGAELKPAPPLGGGEAQRGIVGVGSRAGAMVFVLDPLRLRDLTEPLEAAGALAPGSRPQRLRPGGPA